MVSLNTMISPNTRAKLCFRCILFANTNSNTVINVATQKIVTWDLLCWNYEFTINDGIKNLHFRKINFH